MISRHVRCAVLFGTTLFAATSANAAVEISSRPTENMSCTGGVCTPTTKKAVLNVNDLAGMLASGDVTITSGAQARDIEIDAALSWTSVQRLTLDSYRSISFNKPVVVAGTSALAITTNDGGSNGDFQFFGKGHVEFWSLDSNLTINGQSYKLYKTIKSLQAATKHSSGGHFALARSINAKARIYDRVPIPFFNGTLEGLGNTISNLTIDASSSFVGENIGFVGWFYGDLNVAAIRDIGLTSVNVIGVADRSCIGTLVGYDEFGIIKNSYATGQVTGIDASVGGLVGCGGYGTIIRSYAAVIVSGSGGFGTGTGGLVGSFGGGCDGACYGLIDQSYAAGPTTGDSYAIGGLVGYNDGVIISNSYASGVVSGEVNSMVGGLAGKNDDSSGYHSAPILASSYSTASVTGGTGATVGGLIGWVATDADNSDLYWDMETSGINNPHQGAGNIADDPGITGLTTEQFKLGLPVGFSSAIWKEKANINGGYPYLINNPPQ